LHGSEKFLAEAVVELVPADEKTHFHTNAERTIKTHLMDQENFMFVPETLTIQSGDKVRFKNSEEAYHNVMCLDDKPPFNVNLAKTRSTSNNPSSPMAPNPLWIFRCVFHGAMKGWIFVFDHPYFQKTPRLEHLNSPRCHQGLTN
jgi:plastocyanin